MKRDLELLPLAFEPNQGQARSNAEFLAQGRGFSAQFRENQAEFLFSGQAGKGGLLRVKLLNSWKNAAISGEQRLPGTVNYFIGDDREKWRTGVPTFERLRYTSVYPGTDLIYYGNKGKLEFDFQLSPGAAPSRIQMRFEGARSIRVDANGDLVVTASDGRISFQRPVIYQPAEGGRKDLVAGSFKILRRNTIGFEVAEYDHKRPLIIDPILNYSTYLGGYAEATSIAVDDSGDAYITGSTITNFPATQGSYQPGPITCQAENPCVFVAKFNSAGTALLYSTYLSGSRPAGSTGSDGANGIAIDSNGDAFVVGSTGSTDFPVTAGAFQTKNSASLTTGFVTELNSSGTSLLYSTYLGGNTATYINQVALDSSGNAYLAGSTTDTNFPTTQGAYMPALVTKATPGSISAFAAKLNPAGTALVYSTYLAGSNQDEALAIAVDIAGEAYVGGWTTSNNFPVTPGSLQVTREATNYQAVFVTKLNATGSALVYSTYLGGNASGTLTSIALDSSGDAYLTGSTNSPDFPTTPGAFQAKIGISFFNYPQTNAFVTEINSAGTALLYSTFLGGGISLGVYADEGDEATGIALDGQGMVYVTGMSCTGDFPVTAGAFEPQNLDAEITGECTAFLTKMNPAPNTPLFYSTFLGGTGNGDAGDYFYGEEAYGLALDPSGNVYLAGFTVSVDFPTTAGVYVTAFDGPSQGAFVTEFNGSEMKSLPVPTVTLTSSADSVQFGQPVTFTATVNPASGSIAPTGTIGFDFFQRESSDDEGSQFGFGPWTTVALDGSGRASFTTSSLDARQTAVNAFYLGDASNAPAMGTLTQALTYIPTTTTVTSSTNNVPYGTNITFTITVIDQYGKPAQGFVLSGYGNLGSIVTLDNNGQGTWSDSLLPVGTTTIFANFMGYTGDAQSSGTVNVTITALGATPDPTLTPPAGTYTAAQQLTLGDANSAAMVYFTTDGTTPVPGVSAGLPTGFTIGVTASEVFKLVAVAPGYLPSNVVSAAYTINLATPSFTTGPGATTAMIVTRGSSSGDTGTVSVVGTNGFAGTVSLTCSVTSAMTVSVYMPTCTLTPASLSIIGPMAQTSTLTVNTTAASSAQNRTERLFRSLTGGTLLALVFFFGGFRRHRPRWTILGLFALILTAGITGCGDGTASGSGNGGGATGSTGTPIGSYSITVTGVSGSLTSTVGTVALTVQ